MFIILKYNRLFNVLLFVRLFHPSSFYPNFHWHPFFTHTFIFLHTAFYIITCTQAQAHDIAYVWGKKCTCVYIYTKYTYIYIYTTHLYIHIYIQINFIYIYIYIYVCVCVCVPVYLCVCIRPDGDLGLYFLWNDGSSSLGTDRMTGVTTFSFSTPFVPYPVCVRQSPPAFLFKFNLLHEPSWAWPLLGNRENLRDNSIVRAFSAPFKSPTVKYK